MLPTEMNSIPTIALLSAAAATDAATQSGANKTNEIVGGQSLLEYQISILARAGISRFLVEVDNVTGALLRLADDNSRKGRSVEFVRSGSDVQRLLPQPERLWVQSEALYLAPPILGELLNHRDTFIVTLDGRNENEAFERIDLNTRWAGVALVGSDTVRALQDLPDGWSITSSLLRQALQDKVAFCPLRQQHVQDGDVRIIRSAEDVDALNQHILVNRRDDRWGYFESSVLGPLSSRIAPAIWQSSFGEPIVAGFSLLLAATSLAFGVLGWGTAAVAAGLVAIIFNILREAVVGPDDSRTILNAAPMATWVLLGLSALATAQADMSYSSDGMFAAITVVGLALLAQQLALPVWAQNLLKSPALLAVSALVMTPFGGFAQAMQWIGIGQLGVMIAAKWQRKAQEKKAKQA